MIGPKELDIHLDGFVTAHGNTSHILYSSDVIGVNRVPPWIVPRTLFTREYVPGDTLERDTLYCDVSAALAHVGKQKAAGHFTAKLSRDKDCPRSSVGSCDAG